MNSALQQLFMMPELQDVTADTADSARTKGGDGVEPMQVFEIKESEDPALSRHLLEKVQHTFIHLAEGSKGRCFDPRTLVEACACLKLEFNVWQQNDVSEFLTKLLDRLEASLKKWAPTSFHYLDHTFGPKQTRQKICKECGLKTNKEEKMINTDCQIRGKSDIHETLAATTEADGIQLALSQLFFTRAALLVQPVWGNEKLNSILESREWMLLLFHRKRLLISCRSTQP
jgi:hypothetical protein